MGVWISLFASYRFPNTCYINVKYVGYVMTLCVYEGFLQTLANIGYFFSNCMYTKLFWVGTLLFVHKYCAANTKDKSIFVVTDPYKLIARKQCSVSDTLQ